MLSYPSTITSTKDQIVGAVKETAGKVTNNKDLETSGLDTKQNAKEELDQVKASKLNDNTNRQKTAPLPLNNRTTESNTLSSSESINSHDTLDHSSSSSEKEEHDKTFTEKVMDKITSILPGRSEKETTSDVDESTEQDRGEKRTSEVLGETAAPFPIKTPRTETADIPDTNFLQSA